MPLAYAASESQSGAGTAFGSTTAATGAFNDTGDAVVLAAAGVSKLLTLDFAQITGTVDNLAIVLRTRAQDVNLSPSNLVVAQLYDGATLLGTTTSDTLDSSGSWANTTFVPSDFLIAAVPLDLASNPRSSPTFHLKLTFTNADLSGATISVDGASLATPPKVVSAAWNGVDTLTVTVDEAVAPGHYLNNSFLSDVPGTSIDDRSDSVDFTANIITYVLTSPTGPAPGVTLTMDVGASQIISSASGLGNDAITDFPVNNPAAGSAIPVLRASLSATGANP